MEKCQKKIQLWLKELLIPSGLFSRASVWQSDGEVPDPDAIRERNEASAAFDADEVNLDDGDDDENTGRRREEGSNSSTAEGKASESKRDEGRKRKVTSKGLSTI